MNFSCSSSIRLLGLPFRRLLYFPRTDSGSGNPSMIIELFSILSSNLREGILLRTWDGSSTLPFLSNSTCNENRPQVGGGSVLCIKDISFHHLCGVTVFLLRSTSFIFVSCKSIWHPWLAILKNSLTK